MKKRIKYVFLLFVMLIFWGKVDALSVSKNGLTIAPGGSDTVLLYADVGDNEINEIKFTFIFYSNSVPAEFHVAGGYNCDTVGTRHTITFNEAKTGKILLGSIDISVSSDATVTSASAYAHTAIAKKTDGETIELNSVLININVTGGSTSNNDTTTTSTTSTTTTKVTTTTSTTSTTTTTTKARENKGLLKEIQSKIVRIDLEDDVFEYTVNVGEGTEELDLVAVPNDEKTKVDISNQKISELDDKKIIITLTNENVKEEYVIKINVVPKPTVPEVVIDNGEFVEKSGYRGKWVLAIAFLVIVLAVSIFLINTKKK